jgi:2-polyprenyl-6-methoxyphenol hydroxylase-like FAD-dependent oxidoreductase
MIHNIPQPQFEEFVAQQLPKTVKILRNASFVSCEETDGLVHTTFEDRPSGELKTVSSNFVIACDGAKSKVRPYLGIECDGENACKLVLSAYVGQLANFLQTNR